MDTKQSWDNFRPYKTGDLSAVWADLRDEDKLELTANGLNDPEYIEEVLQRAATKIMTWETEGGPVAVLGVTSMPDPNVGLIWAVASDKARPRWRFAVRNTPKMLDELGDGYMVLTNLKDSRNINQIEWLKKVGFTFINMHEAPAGHTYLEFVRIMK